MSGPTRDVREAVWLLESSSDGYFSSNDVLGVFSSPEKAIAWLRKARVNWHDTEPIIPEWEGDDHCRLSAYYRLLRCFIDPEPMSPDDWRLTGVTAMG